MHFMHLFHFLRCVCLCPSKSSLVVACLHISAHTFGHVPGYSMNYIEWQCSQLAVVNFPFFCSNKSCIMARGPEAGEDGPWSSSQASQGGQAPASWWTGSDRWEWETYSELFNICHCSSFWYYYVSNFHDTKSHLSYFSYGSNHFPNSLPAQLDT